MRLTQILLAAAQPKKIIPGNIWRGKRRLVRKVNYKDIAVTRKALDIEEKNMFYLRHPYVSAKEYQGVGRNFFQTAKKFLESTTERRLQKFYKTVEPRSIESHLRLRINKSNAWE